MRYKWRDSGNQAIDDVGHQLQKMVRGWNESHIGTRYRYIEAVERFIKWVVLAFHLRCLRNLKDKHVEQYAKHLLDKGCSIIYVKVELSGLRYLHNYMVNAGICKTELSDPFKQNASLGLRSNKESQPERAWTPEEVSRAVEYAFFNGKPRFAMLTQVLADTGMRLDEACSLQRDAAYKAVRTGVLELSNTKGGLCRTVWLSKQAIATLLEVLGKTPEGKYLFVQLNEKVHSVEHDYQNWLLEVRDLFQHENRARTSHNLDSDANAALSAHGLRHMWSNVRYKEYIAMGKTEVEARQALAKDLGHGRISVTYKYVRRRPPIDETGMQ